MSKLNLYSVFHLNLAYSSLSEERRPEVIDKCYRPLLQLVEDFDARIGIEAPAYTLEKIREIAPDLIEKLKSLISAGKCEFIASGYMQVIGPLVPAEVNRQNLKIGNAVYQEILGIKPRVAYINEQAYSHSLIKHYVEAGFDAIVMEWNNPAKFHPEWSPEFQYQPQIAVDDDGNSIRVIWNNSIAFQKFQRYATGEIELDEYLKYLESHVGKSSRFFPMYGSDAEVFDFRTLRYRDEAPIIQSGEWQRIRELFFTLAKSRAFSLLSPSRVLKKAGGEYAFRKIRLDSDNQPIPVKKKESYNTTRWALPGRDSIGINTKCYGIYENLMRYQESSDHPSEEKMNQLWKNLCYLWGSDFRTHITEDRFIKYNRLLEKTLVETNKLAPIKTLPEVAGLIGVKTRNKNFTPKIEKKGRKIIVETKCVKAEFNTLKGMAIESLVFKNISNKPLIGLLENDYYNDIAFAEDFFSGHTTLEIPLQQKTTDLERVNVVLPKVAITSDSVTIEADIKNNLGTIHKIIKVYNYANRVDMKYVFQLNDVSPAAFRAGILTYNPGAFKQDSLFYSCRNGGNNQEVFSLTENYRPGHLLSHIVSSGSVLGNTGGCLEVGDEDKSIMLLNNMAEVAALPMIHFEKVDKDNYFLRTFYSLGEFDETSKTKKNYDTEFSLAITAKKNK